MGGKGLGRRRGEERGSKPTTDQIPTLDVRSLGRTGVAITRPGQERIGDGSKRISWIRLAWIPCNYDGSRPGSCARAKGAAGAWRSSTDRRSPCSAACAEASDTPASSASGLPDARPPAPPRRDYYPGRGMRSLVRSDLRGGRRFASRLLAECPLEDPLGPAPAACS